MCRSAASKVELPPSLGSPVQSWPSPSNPFCASSLFAPRARAHAHRWSLRFSLGGGDALVTATLPGVRSAAHSLLSLRHLFDFLGVRAHAIRFCFVCVLLCGRRLFL